MTASRLAAVLVLLSACPASGTVLGRNLLASHRAEEDASQMNAYAASVMTTLQAASRELTEAFASPPPPPPTTSAAKSAKDQCGDWCAGRSGGTDSHCVTNCQAKMYQCNDHNKTRSDEKAAHDECVAKVQAEFSAASTQHTNTTDTHLLAKQHGGAGPQQFSNASTAKLREQQDSLAKLFEHLKANIAKFNKREVDGKVDTEKSVKDMEQRLAKDQARLKDPKLSAFQHELITNRTRTEEMELKYNKQGRQYQHSMFHANLKATHGLMSRVQGVLDAYGQALAQGHLDSKVKESMMKSLTSLPKALVETRSQLRTEQKLRRQGAAYF